MADQSVAGELRDAPHSRQDAERELQYVPKVEAWEDLSDSDSDAATDDERGPA